MNKRETIKREVEHRLIEVVNTNWSNNNFITIEQKQKFLSNINLIVNKAICELERSLVRDQDYDKVLLKYFPEIFGRLMLEKISAQNKNKIMDILEEFKEIIKERLYIEICNTDLVLSDDEKREIYQLLIYWYPKEIELFCYSMQDRVLTKKENFYKNNVNPYKEFIMKTTKWNPIFRFFNSKLLFGHISNFISFLD